MTTFTGVPADPEAFRRRALARVPAETCAERKLLYAGELRDRSRLALIACGHGQADSVAGPMAVWAVHEPTTSGLLNLVDAGSIENDDDLTSWFGRGTDGRCTSWRWVDPVPAASNSPPN